MSQNGCAHTAIPPASWIAAIDSLTVGVVRGLNPGLPSIRYASRNADRSASPSRPGAPHLPGGDDRVGEMGTADRLSFLPSARDVRLVELVAELAQDRAHCLGAPLAILAPDAQAIAQHLIAVVDLIAEHVQILHVAVDRGDLDGRDNAHAGSDPASSACSTPSTVSWSLSASSSTPAPAAAKTTSRGSSAPSEWSEWL